MVNLSSFHINGIYMKKLVMMLAVFVFVSASARAQTTTPQIPPLDTLKNKEAIYLIQKMLKGDISDPLFNQVLLFGNPDCHKCLEVHASLTEMDIPFREYDLRDNTLQLTLHDLVVYMEKTSKVAYGFPLVLYKGSLTHTIQDVPEFVSNLSSRFGK